LRLDPHAVGGKLITRPIGNIACLDVYNGGASATEYRNTREGSGPVNDTSESKIGHKLVLNH